LLERLPRAPRYRLGALTPERVIDDEQGKAGDAERGQLTDGEALEGRGGDQPGRGSSLG
jgi:hypothetical protein